MKKLAFTLIAFLFGSSMITNAQLSFISNVQTLTSNNSWDLRLVDLNADSIPDAVFESKVWFNNGNGNFTKSDLYIGSGLYPTFADLNGDGFVDVLNQDSIFINDGSFHFAYSKKLVSDIAMYSSVLADIDMDGDIDIISCSTVTDRILLNDGNGNFTNTNKSLGGWGQARYAVGDMNGDGFIDIYVSIPHIPPMGGHTPNLIWLGDGAGNFTQKTHDIAGAESRAVILADFDGDDDLDLYVSDATSWGRVFNNDGIGNFTDSGQKLGSRTGDAKAADFNNDGKLDLFICQGDGNGVTGNGAPSSIWMGDGKGKYTDSMQRLQSGNTNSMAVDVSDINNDGKIDAVVANVKLDAQNGYTPMSCPVEIWINNTFICDYFGQTPPGNTAIKFAPGIISKPGRMEYKVVFSSDGNECFITVGEGTGYKVYSTKRVNKTWTEQTVAPFSANQSTEFSSFSVDGNKVFFDINEDIWMSERTNTGWNEAEKLSSSVNTSSHESGYSETADGTIYFTSDRPGSIASPLYKNLDIWTINKTTNQAENIGNIINSSTWDVTPCIAPDGSYLIYTKGDGITMGLFISFKKEDSSWTTPLNMDNSGTKINVLNQNSPSLSPDGKYLFFNRHNQDSADIYWVSTSIIDTLKKIAFPTSAVNAPKTENLISVFPNPSEGVFTITLTSNIAKNATAEIFTIDGKMVLRQTIWNKSETIHLADYTKGIYILKVTADSKIFSQKINLK